MFKPTSHAPDQALRNYALAIYALQAAGFIVGIPYFIAPLLAYWKRKAAAGSWLESHLRWQINSFWFSLAGFASGLVLLSTPPIGITLLSITALWLVYRIGQGWARLSRGQPMGGAA